MKTAKAGNLIIIGAGLAGIAAAIRLRKQHYNVIVLEKNATYGGKLAEFTADGFRWDKGPSLFTSPQLVDELFELCEVNPRNYFNYIRHETACTYYFCDGTVAKFSGDHQKLKKELIAVFNEDFASKTLAYLEHSKKTYRQIGDFFVDHPKATFKDLFRKELLVRYPHFLSAKMRKTLHRYNQSKLKHPKLVQVFDRFGTYNGSNPYRMSGLYSMIPHLEHNTGTFFPEKGMRAIVDSLYHLAVSQGVEFRFNEQIKSVLPEAKGYCVLTETENFMADKLVCAIDHLAFYRYLLKDETMYRHYSAQERSSSGFVFYWAVREAIPQLGLHTIFFSSDYRAEFEQIFTAKTWPDDPTVYIHISAVANPSDAPAGAQNWFVMINTPAGFLPTAEDIENTRQKIFERIQKQFGVQLKERISSEQTWNSQDIETETGAFLGALYGASSNGKLAALKRHGNTQKKYPGLYFCGGTVHPGGGIPLVLKSAKIIAGLIQHES